MKTKVLFLCTHNSARSQMAEAFLRRLAGDSFEPFSAGLEPGHLHPLTVQVMQEVGIDLDGQRSKSVSEYLGKAHFGYLITVCDQADSNCPTTFPSVRHRLHWSFEDPAAFQGTEAARLDKFRQVRDQIERQVRTWVQQPG
jgi:arsenate reductase